MDKLKTILKTQSELIDRILLEQKVIHSAVTEKNWETLETSLYLLNTLSSSFSDFEDARLTECNQLAKELGFSGTEVDLYKITSKLEDTDRKEILDLYRNVHQKLVVSKIKNSALNDYIRITKEFLQGIFDTVIPQRRSIVYSRKGVIKSEPERLILDTLL